jgi:hypothetical protein
MPQRTVYGRAVDTQLVGDALTFEAASLPVLQKGSVAAVVAFLSTSNFSTGKPSPVSEPRLTKRSLSLSCSRGHEPPGFG